MKSVAVRTWLTPTVFAIGLASLFSDACYELIIPLLPSLLATLGGGAAALGLIEGLADALASFFKLWGGRLADVTRRRRAWAAAGYVGVGLFMPAIALATSVTGVLGLRAAAWICRGFRSPIRDTLLVDGTDAKYVNRAFGFQRALDTVGAVIGPAVAIALIAAHVPVRNAILVGIIPGLLAPLMYLFVSERPRTEQPPEKLHIALANLPGDFKRYVLAAGTFGLGNFSATLLVLVAIRALSPHMAMHEAIAWATALYLVHNALFALLAFPASLLSERIGSGRLLLAAFSLYCIVAILIAAAPLSIPVVAAAFVLAATAIAIVEPMEGTFATELLQPERRGTGFGLLAAVNGIGDFVASAGVGYAWQMFGAPTAFGAAAAVCAVGVALLAPLAWRHSVKRA